MQKMSSVTWISVAIFTVCFVQVTDGFPTHCGNGFIGHGTSCYKFVQEPSSWPDAKVMCDAMGASLVEIESPWEDEWLLEHIFFYDKELSQKPLWIGSTDMMNENEWTWMNSQRPLGYRNWNMQQPEALRKGHGHCLAIRPQPRYLWDEVDCQEKLNFVCERSIDA